MKHMKQCYVKMIKHGITHTHCTEIKMGREWPDGDS